MIFPYFSEERAARQAAAGHGPLADFKPEPVPQRGKVDGEHPWEVTTPAV